ncbi:flavin reductase [Brooklawnia cerclae]|uniref:Flavin reductase (DIM6/NTAB) family NADH-FMN oxidoreductase RutF n=1 Tax=Brooklawnia cerclae TaxID=349934 RepID=A0ABX0SLH2_9ACTN|nr:flavin reductase (DIM6/NTAB) family NADH-FMN oxidoreductase RutF [Brooklawnia cerclae]
MSIHSEHPFQEAMRDPGRRFRGRLGGRVALWATGTAASGAGLTVSSQLLVAGDPWRAVAAVNPDSDFADAVGTTGLCTTTLLESHHLALAEAFAGGPAPGGPFRLTRWADTEWGPVPDDAGTWAGMEVESIAPLGWLLLVTCRVRTIVIGDDDHPLAHRRGRYELG